MAIHLFHRDTRVRRFCLKTIKIIDQRASKAYFINIFEKRIHT